MPDRLRDRATCIVTRDDKLLLVSDSQSIFMLPGGGVDPGETLRSAAIRELREETGLVAACMKYLHVVETSKNRCHIFVVEVKGEVDVSGGECHGFLWWDMETELPIYPHVSLIRDWLRSSWLTGETTR